MVHLVCKNVDCKKSSQVLRGWSFCPYCGKKYEEFGISVNKMVDMETRSFNLNFLCSMTLLIISSALTVVTLWLLMPAKNSDLEANQAWAAYVIFGFIGWSLLYSVGEWLIKRFLIRPKFPELYQREKE